MTRAPQDLLPEVTALAERAGALILEHYQGDIAVRAKADASPVTAADEAAEALILPGLRALAPELPAVAEEMVAAGQVPSLDDQPFWLVDPLDGTKEFLSRNGEFTVNIALVEGAKPVLGVVLVERTKRAVRFTPLGNAVVAKAHRILREAEELSDLVQSSGQPLSGEVRMSVIPTIAPFLLPRMLPRLRRERPNLKLFLREEPSAAAIESLHHGRADCVLLALTSGSMAADTIAEGVKKGDTSEAQLRKWEPAFTTGMERMRRLVCEFYDGMSFGRFVRKHPHLKDLVTDVLIGDVFKPDVDVLWPLMDELRAEQQAAGAKA